MTANLFDSEPDFGREGMSARVVGQHAGPELLGATLYELEPGGRQADLHLHQAGGGVFVMTEPPYTGAPHDESQGRVLRLLWRDAGLPILPDEPAESAPGAS